MFFFKLIIMGRKFTGIVPVVEGMRARAATELEARSASSIKHSTNLSRSRSAQSLKLLGDSSSMDDKMTILAQLFWVAGA